MHYHRLLIICWLTVTWIMLTMLGCARVSPPAAPPEGAGVPKQLQQQQVIVTLAPATPERWASLATALAQTYDVRQVGAFPLTSLGVQCLVFQIPPERTMEDVL